MLCYMKENNTIFKQILEAVKEKPRATVTDLATPDQTRCFHLELDPAVTVEELDHIADLPNIVSRYSLYIILNILFH